ncbi:hypothetical protein L484_020885 [Morus notabilis]|uniref:Uncharacterized protein n=1 Tax=Morus notabilis TaxID=981085 RepID=W9QP41_9ROSA|nr:hypothetical protein L484_020885 [Morus notabilis]
MKAMPLPFEEFQGKGVLDFSSSSSSSSDSPQNWTTLNTTTTTINTTPNTNTTTLTIKKSSKDKNCYVGSEPTSVLDARRSPSPPTSSSTLSSSLGGGGGSNSGGGSHSTDTTPTGVAAAAAAVSDHHHNQLPLTTTFLEEEKCGLGMEDWESVLSESPGQEQSILRLIMADVDDPSLGLNKILETTTTTTTPTTGGSVSHSQDMEFNAGFGVVDDQVGGYGFEPPNIIDPHSFSSSDFHFTNNVRLAQNTNPTMFSPNNLLPVFHNQQQLMESVVDAKPQIFNNNPQMVMINQNQAAQFSHHNPSSALVMPLTYAHLQEHHVVSPPPAKRLNTGVGGLGGPNFHVQQKVQFPYTGQEQQLQLLSHQIRPALNTTTATTAMGVMKQKSGGTATATATSDEQLLVGSQPHQAAELIETGTPVLAQGILARLNHQLSPLGKPFQRAAFYFKEALQLLLQTNNNSNVNNNHPFALSSSSSPFNLILKIGAYKTFSEISPVLQFANFTCNQAILEATEGFTRVHVIDFDIGYGGQWASFMQELALRNSGVGNGVSLKITAFASPSTHDEFELGFTQENLKHFASEINLAFELEILSLEMLNSGLWPQNLHVSDNEAIAVNLPIGPFSNYPLSLPLVLRFVKQLSPKIVVSLERGCDRTDVPFPAQLVHALHSYSGLLESLDAVNVNLDAMQKIEKCLLQPGIEKIVLGRHRNSLDRMLPWRSAFLNLGFSPLTFSNFTESQAECLVQRTPVRGFHVEKKQSSSLVLCWQRKELVSASAWRC